MKQMHKIPNKHTVEGSLSQNASRHILQESSQASWIPPSTKAAADVKCDSDCLFSSIPTPYKTEPLRIEIDRTNLHTSKLQSIAGNG